MTLRRHVIWTMLGIGLLIFGSQVVGVDPPGFDRTLDVFGRCQRPFESKESRNQSWR